jgi:uncharacterized protein (DUF885 family)
MNTRRCLPGLILAISLMPCSSRGATDTSNLEARRKQLNQLIAEEWNYEMQESPESATVVGDYRYNDKWSDLSLAHVSVQRADLQKWLTKFQEVDATDFPEQEKLNQLLMVRNLKERIEYIDLKLFLMPVDQFNGVHLNLAVLVSFIPFETTKQYDDYLARLHKIPTVIDQEREIRATCFPARQNRDAMRCHRHSCWSGKCLRTARGAFPICSIGRRSETLTRPNHRSCR